MQALQLLVDIALGPEGGQLASAWWLVLRALSILEGMVEHDRALRASQRLQSSAPTSPRSTGGAEAANSAAAPVAGTVEASVRAAFSGLTAMLAPGPSAPGSPRTQLSGALRSGTLPRRSSVPDSLPRAGGAAPLKGPGAALLAWARGTAGSEAIDAVYTRTAALDGDHVVLFVRALCAVSTQELQPLAGAAPRVTSLHRLSEVLLLNMDRVRLVWRHIWAVAAPHLVSAACHEGPDVALVAVNALRQLVSRLLGRAELEQFQWQGTALRPFVDVLRHASDGSARSMAMQCLQQFLHVRPQACLLLMDCCLDVCMHL